MIASLRSECVLVVVLEIILQLRINEHCCGMANKLQLPNAIYRPFNLRHLQGNQVLDGGCTAIAILFGDNCVLRIGMDTDESAAN